MVEKQTVFFSSLAFLQQAIPYQHFSPPGEKFGLEQQSPKRKTLSARLVFNKRDQVQ
ncbi:MAG: hypothetical protein HKP12_09530 [Gammaproteobacteria bacterium]|nr:hypothetical protein [Gammaproteobacteria bacterium]NNJ97388.1 hypothetical protein [Gammaproteobacteria bacterium]